MKKKATTKKSAGKKTTAKKTAAKKKTTGKKTTRRPKTPKKSTAKKTAPKKLTTQNAIVTRAGRRSTLTFLTESLPAFTVGHGKKFLIEAVGGTKPYSFGITQGPLPAGLHFDYRGILYGTPAVSGDTTIFVKVTDFVGAHLTQAFDLQVMDA
jgi:Putative Ig domain